jgi:hypothetical protein
MLTNEDPNVVKLSIETLFLISKSEEDRPTLANHPGLMQAIQQKLLSPNFETKKYALSIYGTLQPHVVQPAPGALPAATVKAETSQPKEAKDQTESLSYTFIINDSLDEDDRQILEDAVLQLKGVISLFIDIYSRKCIVRTHSRPEPILAAICACGVSARLHTACGAVDKENGPAAASASSSDQKASWFGWGQPNSQAIVKQGEAGDAPPGQSGWFGRIARSLWG